MRRVPMQAQAALFLTERNRQGTVDLRRPNINDRGTDLTKPVFGVLHVICNVYISLGHHGKGWVYVSSCGRRLNASGRMIENFRLILTLNVPDLAVLFVGNRGALVVRLKPFRSHGWHLRNKTQHRVKPIVPGLRGFSYLTYFRLK